MARFYGLPKVHKEGVPLRPIVAFRDSPMSGLAKWLSSRISYLVEGSSTTVKSAEEFLDRIRSLRIEDDEVMVSFDVVSLFTSIPQGLAIKTIKDLLEQKGSGCRHDHLQPQDLVNLLEVCLKTYFTFQGTTFEQVKGTPMGSPISSTIAEAVLQQLEHVAMSQCCPKFWARYVDDTFVIIKRSQKADFVGILNSVCADLQFTEEEEHQGELAFLDVLVHRQPNGTLMTRVHRKSTHTDRVLHYNSNHPVAHKASCIRTLFKRVGSHCSTAKARMDEKKHLLKVCKRNGYPMKFIRRHGLLTRPFLHAKPPVEEQISQGPRVTLPYISNVSEATARLLAPYDVRVAHNPNQTLRCKVMRLKDPLPVTEKSGVIYRVNCENCPANYVGETSKRVKTRIHEHKLAVKRGDQYSQIGTHMRESGHMFDFNNVRVMASDNTKGGRLFKEAWLSNGESINRHVDLCPAHVTLRTWTMRGSPSGGKQHNTTMCLQQIGLREGTDPENARTERDRRPCSILPMETGSRPQWSQGRGDGRELTADRLDASPEAVRDLTGIRSCMDIIPPYGHELRHRNTTYNIARDSVAGPTHNIPLLSCSRPDNVKEEREDEKGTYYNLRASTCAYRHLRGVTPRRSANCARKDPASLSLGKVVHPQRTGEGIGGNEIIAPAREEGSSHLAKVVNTGKVANIGVKFKLTPVGEKTGEVGGLGGAVCEIKKQDGTNIMSAWAADTNSKDITAREGCERRDRGRRGRVKVTSKQWEEDKQHRHGRDAPDRMGLKDPFNLRLHEEGSKDCDIDAIKESGEIIACNTETTIGTRVDWLGPMTRSRGRAQRDITLINASPIDWKPP